MLSSIGADVAAAAVSLTRSHPHAPPRDVLDVVFTDRAGATWLQPAAPFGQLLAAAFDRGMSPAEWAVWSTPPADPALCATLATVWRDHVLGQLAARYGLALLAPNRTDPQVLQSAGADQHRASRLSWTRRTNPSWLPHVKVRADALAVNPNRSAGLVGCPISVPAWYR